MPYQRNLVNPARPRIITGDTETLVQELLAQGLPGSGIATELGLPRTSVGEYARSVRGSSRPTIFTAEVDATVRELKDSGHTQAQIAAQLGFHQSAISYSLRRTASTQG